MKDIYFIDTAGQVTAVVTTALPIQQQTEYAKNLMNSKRVEQVGFLNISASVPTFRMMGGELSINGSISGFYVFNNSNISLCSRLYLTDLNVIIFGKNVNNKNSIVSFPSTIIQRIDGCIVTLLGIKYQVIAGIPSVKLTTASMKYTLKLLTLDSPAAGLIFYDKKCIQPLLYVKETNSYVWESACGSGSLAFSLITGVCDVVQPSGNVITISGLPRSRQMNRGKISISTECKEVDYASLSNTKRI